MMMVMMMMMTMTMMMTMMMMMAKIEKDCYQEDSLGFVERIQIITA